MKWEQKKHEEATGNEMGRIKEVHKFKTEKEFMEGRTKAGKRTTIKSLISN